MVILNVNFSLTFFAPSIGKWWKLNFKPLFKAFTFFQFHPQHHEKKMLAINTAEMAAFSQHTAATTSLNSISRKKHHEREKFSFNHQPIHYF
jgi:hypothetical protein